MQRRLWAAGIALSVLLLPPAGCNRRFGTGGTGETVIPEQRLREIPTQRMEQMALATRPATGAAATRPATRPVEKVELSIDQARAMAMRNNLDLKVEVMRPTIARYAITEEEARYELLFTGGATYSKLDQPTDTRLEGSSVDALDADLGMQFPLRTGGVIDVRAPFDRVETNNQFATLNPSYASDLTVSLRQPLLRGFGFDVNAQPIRVAFYNHQIAQARTKLEVIRILANVDRAYWRLNAARGEVSVRRREYDLASAQLARTQRMRRAGEQAQVDVVRAESGVADSVERLIQAENALRDRQRDLKRIINEEGLKMASATEIITTTPPTDTYYELSPQRLVRLAMDQRMELLEQELRIALETAGIRVARNDMLPLLSLQYTYNINGLGDSWDQSMRMTREKHFEDHIIGLRVEVPIGNEAARSRLRRALATRLQELATREQRAQAIEQEVLNAVDQLDTNFQRILAARKRVELAQRVLEGEIRQFDAGVRTSTEVLDAQTRFADAASALVAALVEYQISQVDIAFATGTILGSTRVTWTPAADPQP